MAGAYTRKGIIGGSTICRHSSRTLGTYTRTSGYEELQSSFSPAVKALGRRLTPPGGLLHSIPDELVLGMHFYPFFIFSFLCVSSSSEMLCTNIYCDGSTTFMFTSTESRAVSMNHVVCGCFRYSSILEGVTTQGTNSEVQCNAE